MWTCPQCERNFKSTNQSHMCAQVSIDDLFEGKPEELLLAFDKLLISVIDWDPCSVGATKKAIVFAKGKAWLIARPMTKWLEIYFYYPEKIEHRYIHKYTYFRNSYAHYIRVVDPSQIDDELILLLKRGYDSA